MPASRRPRWVLLVVALCAVAAWYFATQTITSRQRLSAPSLEAQVTGTLVKRRLSATSNAVVLHAMTYDSHSGATTIRWYDSDFEPTRAQASAVVSLLIDGTRVASTIKSSLAGIYDDGQGDLAWYGNLSRGRHRIVVQLQRASEAWGLPYTDASRPGVDELIVRSDHTHAG
jgi:hypothetical protein